MRHYIEDLSLAAISKPIILLLLFAFSSQGFASEGIDAQINQAMKPIADTISSFIFYKITIAGAELPLIVLWLLGAAAFFTVYFNFLSLIGATIGGFGLQNPFMCNGANFAYKKDFYKQLNGFNGNDEIASGDDVFLLQKAIDFEKDAVQFLKSKQAIVLTKPQPDFSSLKWQRVRWASKTTKYNNSFGKLTGLVVLLTNASLICWLLFFIISNYYGLFLFLFFLLKVGIDFALLFKTASFFNQKQLLNTYVFSSIIYPFFCVYIAVISFYSSYKWKGRAFKN